MIRKTRKFTVEIDLYAEVVDAWVTEHFNLGPAQATDPDIVLTAVATNIAGAVNGETERVFDISVRAVPR